MNIARTITNDDRHPFYQKLSTQNLAPLWEVMKGLVPPEPRNRAVPCVWNYSSTRRLLMEAGSMLTAAEAERRVLVFENPSFPGTSRINSTIYAGMQLILPNESAPAHKHSAGALRFILESRNGFTTVAGERADMSRGDLIITPSGAFHDHGNDGDECVIWIDGLDLPVVNFFEAGFSEELDEMSQEIVKPNGHSLAAYGSGLLPMQPEAPFGATSPVFSYPYTRARDALLTSSRSREADPYNGFCMRYANPIDGGWVMPTIAAWLVYLPAGFTTLPYRSTDNQTVIIAEGAAIVRIGGDEYCVGESDIIALPGWTDRTFEVEEDTVLFFFSDRSAQEKLGLWKERRAEIGLAPSTQ